MSFYLTWINPSDEGEGQKCWRLDRKCVMLLSAELPHTVQTQSVLSDRHLTACDVPAMVCYLKLPNVLLGL